MRLLRSIVPALLVGGAAVAIASAPAAVANPLLPDCEVTGSGGGMQGGETTDCASPGNVQIDSTPPVYSYPYYDEFYGPGFII